MNSNFLSIVVCPVCKSSLIYDRSKAILVCKADKLAYPVKDGIPVMLVEEAVKLNIEDVKQYG
ncbi:MAG: Trm112 family protein [Francisellaceae bacterium]